MEVGYTPNKINISDDSLGYCVSVQTSYGSYHAHYNECRYLIRGYLYGGDGYGV